MSVCHSDHLRILSRPEWVEPVVMFLRDKALAAGACDQATAQRLVIAFTEAVTNAIIHGNYELSSELKEEGGKAYIDALEDRKADADYVERIVDIRVDYQPDRCIWTVTDQGNGFDVEDILKKLESDDPDTILASGRGIAIMQAFVNEVSWDQGGRQIRLAIDTKTGSERRTSERVKYTATIGVQTDQIDCFEAIARDLSTTGIAFISTQAIRKGDTATITLDLHHENERQVAGTIVRCNAIADPFYDVAVHFDTAIELDDPPSEAA